MNQLIPTSLFGINSELCNEFFKILPELLEKSEIEDPEYEKMLVKPQRHRRVRVQNHVEM